MEEVFNNLDQIESASYYSTIMPFAPGDTSPHFIAKRFYEVYINPADTFVGASFIYFSGNDYSEFGSCYDGSMRTIVNRDLKIIEIVFKPTQCLSGHLQLHFSSGPKG